VCEPIRQFVPLAGQRIDIRVAFFDTHGFIRVRRSSMRLPLRTQIWIPVAGALVATIGLLGFVNAWLAAANQAVALETRIRTVAETISRASFPLTEPILAQIKELVDAELLVQDTDGKTALATATELPARPPTEEERRRLRSERVIQSAVGEYLRATTAVRSAGGRPQWLHIYYPRTESTWRRLQAIYPAVIIAGLALVFAGAFAAWFERSVKRCIRLPKGIFGRSRYPRVTMNSATSKSPSTAWRSNWIRFAPRRNRPSGITRWRTWAAAWRTS
jgi:hypothetical protein